MAIVVTYDTPTETFEVTGGTEGVPATMEDIYSYAKSNSLYTGDDKVVESPEVGTFTTRASIEIGDGFTSTWFTSKDGEHVHFEDGFFFNIKSNATLDWGELVGTRGVNGVHWSIGMSGDTNIISGSSPTAVWNIYGSSFIRRNGSEVLVRNGSVTALDSSLSSSRFGIIGGTHSFTRTEFYNGVRLIVSSTLLDCSFAGTPAILIESGSSIVDSPLLLDTPQIRQGGTGSSVIINPQGAFIPLIVQSESNALTSQLPTNIHISARTGIDLESATIVCESHGNIVSPDAGSTFYKCITSHTSGTFADDLASEKWELTTDAAAASAGVTGGSQTGEWITDIDYVKSAEIFSENTDSDGDITEQTVDYKKWIGTSEALLSYSPHTFTISAAGKRTLVLENITVDSEINWHFELQEATGGAGRIVQNGLSPVGIKAVIE